MKLHRTSLLLLAALFAALSVTSLHAADGPTPYPDASNEAAWPGKGPIRSFPWMVDNRKYFWTQREKDQGAVVFVGDSLTGNWQSLAQSFPGLKVANRGVGGDTSRGVLFRFREDVLDLKPRAIVICAGSNDLSAHGDPASAAENIATMLAQARAQNPAVPIVLCTIAPRANPEAPTKPGAQADLNARIAKLGAGQEHFVVLDLFPVLGTPDGQPVGEFFREDHLHLAEPGYQKWAEALRPVLEKLGVKGSGAAPARVAPAPPAASVTPPSGAPAAKAGVRFGTDGIEIDAGSVGKFTFEYPALLDDSRKPVRKLLEKNAAAASATLKYEGGLQLDLALGEGGTVRLKFSDAPAEVKFLQWDMHIPISFNQGGKWKIGDKEGEFPKEKPGKPHLYQGNTDTVQITNYEGRSLTLKIPPYSYLELTDNREWNWAIFHVKGSTPFAPDRKELSLTFTTQGTTGKAAPLVDALGQSAREDWPGKVKSIEELKADVNAEKTYYASLQPPAVGPYGGLPGSKEKLGLKATGFFHVEKKGERWLLVDPAGEAFFHLGLCSAQPSEDYTLVKGREAAYEWLPPREGEFASVWRDGTAVSFQLANMIRKYGEPYDSERYTARMIERMRKWGFNSIGAFSGGGAQARKAAKIPGVEHLPLGVESIPGIGQVWDPFDEKTRSRIEQDLAKSLPSRADDPLVIGYFITNEPIYENIQHVVPTLKASAHACKRRFVQGLGQKYKTPAAFNVAWSLKVKAFDELSEMVVPVETAAAKADVQEYVSVFLDEYFRLVSESFRRHDRNHLLLGSRLMPGTINNEQLCRIMGKYVDVMSFNYYTYGMDTEFLRRIYKWTGRPLMLSEFYWSAAKESGLTGGREVATQQERGLAYRNYVEQSAALGIVVGIEWFTLNDQAVTGRWFQGFDGERANTGVIAVTDRPWKAALAEMMKTNYDIYKVWLGERPPFAWDDPRFKIGR